MLDMTWIREHAEAVEPQDSASPYHDWNARVSHQCYAPNSASRILDAGGYIARGGSFFYNSMTGRTVNRAALPPDFRSPMLGVRVCATYSPTGLSSGT